MADDLFAIDTAQDNEIRKRVRKPGFTRRKLRKAPKPPAERLERNLARAVFGAADDDVEDDAEAAPPGDDRLAGSDDDKNDDSEGDDDDDDDNDDEEEEGEGEDTAGKAAPGEGGGKRPAAVRQAAWVDEDDDGQEVAVKGGAKRLYKLRQTKAETSLAGSEYVQRLRAQFASVQPDAGWAALPPARAHKRFDEEGVEEDATEGGASDDAVVRSGDSLLGKGRALPPTTLSVRRMVDLNAEQQSKSVTPVVQWHPNAQLALTAGPDKTLRLFRVDGTSNHMIQSVHMGGMPIHSAAFSSDGAQILVCGQSKHWCAAATAAGPWQGRRGGAARGPTGEGGLRRGEGCGAADD